MKSVSKHSKCKNREDEWYVATVERYDDLTNRTTGLDEEDGEREQLDLSTEAYRPRDAPPSCLPTRTYLQVSPPVACGGALSSRIYSRGAS